MKLRSVATRSLAKSLRVRGLMNVQYAIKDGKSSVFVEGADVVEQPNGLLVDGSRLILGTIGPAPTPGAPNQYVRKPGM